MTQRVILTRGLPGSGKSTWARERCDAERGKWKLVDKDSLRRLLDNGHWSKANEKFVLAMRDYVIRAALEDGKNVIVHDTNFEESHHLHITELVRSYRALVELKDFDTPLEECIKRDLERTHSVGESVIRKMHDKYLAPSPAKPPPHVDGAPKALIVDLDGTLAHIGNRSPYDAAKCEGDELNEQVAFFVDRWLYANSYKVSGGQPGAVILMSGRQEKDRVPTVRWLEANGVLYDALFMRTTDDARNDAVVKRELYEQHVAGKYNVELVVDDRARVVAMWRSLGLQCWQVAEGNF